MGLRSPPLAGRRSAHRPVSQEAEHDAVEWGAIRLLVEMSHRPRAAAAFKFHAVARLVAALAAVPGPATNLEAPTELESHLWLAVASQLAILRNLMLKLGILRVINSQPRDAPTPD